VPYRVRFEKACHVPVGETFVVATLESPNAAAGPDPFNPQLDRSYDDIALRPSFGTVAVTADQPDAVLFIDGERRGPASQPVTDVCDGERAIDVRAPTGRFSQRVRVEFEKTTNVQATLLPTYALLPLAKPNGTAADRTDLTRTTEVLRTKSLRFIAVESATGAAPLAATSEEAIRRAAETLAQELDTQGVATLSRVAPTAEGLDLELTLFARGSSRPDVVRWSLQSQASIQRAIDRLDAEVQVLLPSLGVGTVDVMRMEGAVVASVDANGPSKGSIAPGDVIVGIGVSSVASVHDLLTLLGMTTESRMTVRLRDKTSSVTLAIDRVPTVVNMHDDLLFNVLVTDLRARLARQQMLRAVTSGAPDRLEQGTRLNLGVALMAVGSWQAAEQMLANIQLENRRGVSRGTVDYLRGICLKQLGRPSEARGQFERASQEREASLSEYGPAISYLAMQELVQVEAGKQPVR
jgi:hypothetical protein